MLKRTGRLERVLVPWNDAAVDVSGKVAVVTGAGSGIGRARAFAFAREGASVVVADVDDVGGAETVGLIHDAGGTATFVRADVTEPRSLEALYAATEAEYGGIDIVHNNAGLVCGEPLWPEITPETLMRVLQVNLGGVVVGTSLAIPYLRKRGGGAIVNTASMAALYPMEVDPIYSATKAGVTMFTRACAQHAAEGIRVNSVLPGLVDTALLPKSGDGERWADWAYLARDFMGIMGPEVVADAVLDLVRDDSAVAEERVVGALPQVDKQGNRVEVDAGGGGGAGADAG
jgi:NAD(P)-dependent dehydrogenase (short-subunit alcohol dehydrogenase family)